MLCTPTPASTHPSPEGATVLPMRGFFRNTPVPLCTRKSTRVLERHASALGFFISGGASVSGFS